MRWVAIGVSERADTRTIKLRTLGRGGRKSAGGQRRDALTPTRAVEIPGPKLAHRAVMNLGLARPWFALSALAWMGDPSALPAMKVCLFSNPGLWTTGREPERPAPSLLQGVLGLAVGR